MRGGTSLLVRLPTSSLPSVLHWGPALVDGAPPAADDRVVDQADDLGAVLVALAMPATDSALTTQEAVAVLPQHSTGWLGRPGLLGSRAGHAWSVAFDDVTHEVHRSGDAGWQDAPPGAVRILSTGLDTASALRVTTELELHAGGLVRLRAAVRNLGAEVYEVSHLEPALPVPAQARELLDLTGRHAHERHPQRRPFDVGGWVREAWGGRSGHDAPTLLCAGAADFGFRRGRVWGVHVAWSGNQVTSAERTVSDWRLLRGGELLLPGEIRLGSGEDYASPWLVGSWGEGLDALSQRIHRYLRARPQHPTRPRPVLLNTWEAVYFDHDLDRLLTLADQAAAIGVERFVLDDGWFPARRNDHAGLGDWWVDPTVWPDGLHPLVDRVHDLGMEFGLWFEPEMVNLDSDLARTHPEWLFATDHGPSIPSRYQHVLDLGHEGAFGYLLERISALVDEYRIAYLKWDHNRPLLDAGHQPTGRPGVHAHTLAVYRLMAQLKQRHPGLEIESCAGGGARIDLGIAEVTDRVWVSDCIDAHERHRMVRWTGLLLPPELLGTHVGSGVDHSTGRTLDLGFRAGTALWGHLGVETDLTRAGADEVDALRRWIRLHREVRDLLHSGDVVHADPTNPVLSLDGVVAVDRSQALYRLSVLDSTLTWPPGRVQLPGLAPDRRYRVSLLHPDAPDPDGADPAGGAPAGASHRVQPPWTHHGVELAGVFLDEVGVQCPLLGVDQLVLIRALAL
jgi:alpha-galactosidase